MSARTIFQIGQTYPLRYRGHSALITAIDGDRVWGMVSGPSYDQPKLESWDLRGSKGLGYPVQSDLVAPLPGFLGFINELVQP